MKKNILILMFVTVFLGLACTNLKNDDKENSFDAFADQSTTWDFLQPGDVIDVIAPSSPPKNPQDVIARIKRYFADKSITVNIPDGMIAPTPILEEANTVEKRVDLIMDALTNKKSKAIWAILGGGWGTELLDRLKERIDQTKIPYAKPILGYSDVTALQIFFNQYLGVTSIHCIELGANGDIEPAWNQSKIQPVLNLLTGKTPTVTYQVDLLNQKTMPEGTVIKSKIVGGNSLVLNALNGSDDFTLDTKNKVLFIESVALIPGELSRILNGLRYSKAVKQADAILLGNFVQQGGIPNPELVEKQFTLIREFFANALPIPVFHSTDFGHGPVNNPLPLNTTANFSLLPSGKVSMQISANLVD